MRKERRRGNALRGGGSVTDQNTALRVRVGGGGVHGASRLLKKFEREEDVGRRKSVSILMVIRQVITEVLDAKHSWTHL